MAKVLSQLSSFLRKTTYLPCTMIGTHVHCTMKTVLFKPAFSSIQLKLLTFVKIFNKTYFPFSKTWLTRIKAFFYVPVTVYTVSCTLYQLLCEGIGPRIRKDDSYLPELFI